MASKNSDAVFFAKVPEFFQLVRRQSQYSVKRFNKRDVADFITAVVKKISKSSVICLDPALIGQKHIPHNYDRSMGNQRIKVEALDSFGQFQILFGHFEKHLDIPSLPVNADDISIGQSGIG